MNSHACSRELVQHDQRLILAFLGGPSLKCSLCVDKFPSWRLMSLSVTFLFALSVHCYNMFSAPDCVWPLLFPLSEVPSCHSIYMRQEGFLAHPSRTEVKFSIIEIPYKYLSKSSHIPRMQPLHPYILWETLLMFPKPLFLNFIFLK